MALTSWKVFPFFSITELSPPDSFAFESATLASIATGSSNLFIGTQDGTVHILNSQLKVVRSFQAYEKGHGGIRQRKQVDGTALLVTVAEDLSSDPVLKVWALDKVEKGTGAPKCLSTLAIKNRGKTFPISAFAALNDLSQLAVGFANGSVTLVRGDLIHDRGAKQRTVFESEEPITGVEFREASTQTTLYLSTTGRILTLTISGKGQGQPAKPLEDIGCGVGCMTLDKNTGDIVVVRDDAVYYYNAQGRRTSFAYEGPKQLVKTLREYVALVLPPQSAKPAKKGIASVFGGRRTDEAFEAGTFCLLDTDLKYVAHTESIIGLVREVFIEWGDFFLLTQEGKLFRYHEKTLSQKLEILYAKDLYVLAITLGQKAQLDVSQRNVILRKYGDYLYQRGDFDTAVQQYLKAIDNTEPSQVIRKFLDTQRIHNLIEYLEELHDHDKATVDHTTLLLNCYAKLKDTAKLENFIRSGSNFDFDTAITMCRQGGYYDQAVFLAKKHGEHDLVIDILIEDSKKYDEALDYIWRLEPNQAYPNLMKYARVLLEHCPKDVTQVFTDYYTGAFRPKKAFPLGTIPTVSSGTGSSIPGLASFIPIHYLSSSNSTATPNVSSPVAAGNQAPLKLNSAEAAEAKAAEPPPEYEVPKPRTAFSVFVDHPHEFISFLESCSEQENLEEADKIDLYTTLFEMYLEVARSKEGAEKYEWEAKARGLIDTKTHPISPSSILLLSHLTAYRTGTILIQEQQSLLSDIFRSYTSATDTAGAIKALRKYGPQEPSLYPAALAYFTSSEKVLAEAGDEVDAVLRKIESDGLLAPLQVIQTISANGIATMGLIKRYLADMVERERREMANNRRLATSYRTETKDKRDELGSLATTPTVLQSRRCALCGASLDLPAVHFLCKHSFHQRCVNIPDPAARRRLQAADAERSATGHLAGARRVADESLNPEAYAECPVCEKQNATVKAIQRAQKDSAERHDMFADALGRGRDGLSVIGEWFGRGVMDSGIVGSDLEHA